MARVTSSASVVYCAATSDGCAGVRRHLSIDFHWRIGNSRRGRPTDRYRAWKSLSGLRDPPRTMNRVLYDASFTAYEVFGAKKRWHSHGVWPATGCMLRISTAFLAFFKMPLDVGACSREGKNWRKPRPNTIIHPYCARFWCPPLPMI